MTFEEWYDNYMYWHDNDEVDPEHLIRIAQRAWEAAFNEGVRTLSENLQKRLGLEDDS